MRWLSFCVSDWKMLLKTLCFATNADYSTCPVTNVGIEISFNWDFALMFHGKHALMYSCGANPSRTTELCTCFPFTLILPFPERNANLNFFLLYWKAANVVPLLWKANALRVCRILERFKLHLSLKIAWCKMFLLFRHNKFI